MSLASLRSQLLQHCVNIGDESVSDTNQGQWGDRVDLAIQGVIEDFVNAYSWSWRLKTGTCTATLDGAAALPADFGTFGSHGGVSINAERRTLLPVPEHQLLELRTRTSGTAARPECYALAGQTDEVDASGNILRTILVHKRPEEPVDLDLAYYFRPPILTEETAEVDFGFIPAEYHAGPLYDGASARLLFGLGDPRSVEMEQRYQLGKARAWTNDHSYNWPRKRPRFSSRMGVYR